MGQVGSCFLEPRRQRDNPVRQTAINRRTMTIQTSYQTAPLREYGEQFRQRALVLFGLIRERLGRLRVREYKGSFSILQEPGLATAAKIVIYEAGKGSVNGPDPALTDGIYIWV